MNSHKPYQQEGQGHFRQNTVLHPTVVGLAGPRAALRSLVRLPLQPLRAPVWKGAHPHHCFHLPRAASEVTDIAKCCKKMENKSGGKLARRFAFSWADEVEREEREQQQNEPPPRLEEKGERAKADPFGAARPREVVLAEKGVDWRARDRELDAYHRTSTCCRTRAQGKRDATAAPPTPRRWHADSTTPMCHRRTNAPPVSYSGAWGGKRKCAGNVSARQVRPVADQGRRRVFGELNIGEGGSSSCCSSKKSCNPAGTGGTVARKLAAADGESRDDSRVPVMAGMQSGDSGVGQRRRGKETTMGRRKMGSKKTKKQQTLLP